MSEKFIHIRGITKFSHEKIFVSFEGIKKKLTEKRMKAQKKPVQGNKAGAAKQSKAESGEEWVALEEWDKAKLKRKEAGETAG